MIKGEKQVALKFKINKPGIVFFNDYPFYVHPDDTIKLVYQQKYSTGPDSLSISGKNAPYYLFVYQLKKNRVVPGFRFDFYNDSVWMNYKTLLLTNRVNEIQFLKKYAAQNHLSKAFYKFAFDEIKYQYFINCLNPNSGYGFSRKGATGIPLLFYSDLSVNEFNRTIYSLTYVEAIGLYNEYLADSQTGYQLSRYSNEYLSALYDKATKTFQGVSKKMLLLRILFLYKMYNLESYLPAYTSIAEKIKGQYTDPVMLSLVDNLYKSVAVLNKPFPANIAKTSLSDMQGNELTFKDVLNKHKGEVIYADFWATWCIPCVQEMPNSILMQKEYAGKDVVFIFLSLDYKNSLPLWNKTSVQLNIEKEQYLVNNGFEAELSNFINVSGIPAYFIVDKKGNLVSKSVPKPNTAEAKEIIDRLLLQ
jgi:thiol-disulfide isomerase/thioredoxin